jgi:hypothetical protein
VSKLGKMIVGTLKEQHVKAGEDDCVSKLGNMIVDHSKEQHVKLRRARMETSLSLARWSLENC